MATAERWPFPPAPLLHKAEGAMIRESNVLFSAVLPPELFGIPEKHVSRRTILDDDNIARGCRDGRSRGSDRLQRYLLALNDPCRASLIVRP